MDKKRLQELAGIQLNEAARKRLGNKPEEKILSMLLSATFEDWYEEVFAAFVRGSSVFFLVFAQASACLRIPKFVFRGFMDLWTPDSP